MADRKRGYLLITTALAASTLMASAAVAQDTAGGTSQTADTYGIAEIVVTAQKRATNLQDTPVAISAFTGATMEERGIDDIANLQSYVPNLHIGQEQDGFKISLRGIGLQGTSSISDSGVAFYIDNFYIGRPSGGSAVFYDIDRIEVLRGPQGTLYGRNATGGVVNVISKTPTQQFEGQIGASYGSRNLFEARGVVNLPVNDVAALRVSAVYTQEDGYMKNLSTAPGTDDFFGTDGDLTVRGQFLAGTPEDIEVLVSGTYSKLNGTGVAMTYLERNFGGPPPTAALFMTAPPEDPDPLKTDNNAPAYNDTETTMVFGRLTKEFGGAEAVLQVGRMWQTTDIGQDFDGSSVDVSRFHKYQDGDATTVEARLASSGSGPLSWIFGGYFFREDTYILRVVNLNGLAGGNFISLPDFILDEWGTSRTIAGFGSVTYSILPEFRVTGGIRYTEDKKSGRKVTRGNFGQPFPPDIPNSVHSGITKFDKVTWKVGLEWDAMRDVLVYASVSTGYKAGGFNITSDASPYDPESITAYEFGIKSDLFDRRVRVNLDSFYYDYKDMQLTTLGTFAGTNTPGQFTTNAGKARIYGLELDTQFRATPELLLMASYAYTSAKFKELCNSDPRTPGLPADQACLDIGRTGQDLSGNWVPYVAPHTINVGAQYEFDLGSSGSVTAAINHNWHSKKYLREYNAPIDRVSPNGKTDITITYKVGDTGFKLTGYVTNLENDVEKANIFISPGFVGLSATTAYTKPRTFGIRADYKF